MSRHSHWAKIKHTKGAADKKKGALFSKISRMITVAAREGGDPVFNFKLRLVIDQAKIAGMTKDTIERAIAKGSGADKDGVCMSEDVYEGFGPGGVAFMIETISDNKNRAFQNLKRVFGGQGGALGGSGSVAWMFERRGVIRLIPQQGNHETMEQWELKLIDAGAEDIAKEEEGVVVYTKPEALKAVEERIRAAGYTLEYAGLERIAKEKVSPSGDAKGQLAALEEALDEMEDVSEYYTNAL